MFVYKHLETESESLLLLYLEHGNSVTESNKDHVTFLSLGKLIIACLSTTVIKR